MDAADFFRELTWWLMGICGLAFLVASTLLKSAAPKMTDQPITDVCGEQLAVGDDVIFALAKPLGFPVPAIGRVSELIGPDRRGRYRARITFSQTVLGRSLVSIATRRADRIVKAIQTIRDGERGVRWREVKP